MQIIKADKQYEIEVVDFFLRYITKDTDGIYSEEFLCPFGIKAAILKHNIVIATDENKVVGALRFYQNKKNNRISLYQFAIHPDYQGQGLLIKMLDLIRNKDIYSLCPIDSKFNTYYQKTKWILAEPNLHNLNCWMLPAKKLFNLF